MLKNILVIKSFALLIGMILLTFFSLVPCVSAYNTTIAHPFLAEQSILLFNKKEQNKISEKEAGLIIQGVVEEDAIGRYTNHFYNPINQKGLSNFLSAKDWSTNSIEQSVYLKGNQTWQNAVSLYAQDKKEPALISLGHILHLIEDMAVPAHTRNDPHPKGDPYELWAEANGIQKFDNLTLVSLNNLNDFFNGLAGYSNKYFLSEDSVEIFNIEKLPRFFKKISSSREIECLEGKIDDTTFCLIQIKDVGFGKYEYVIKNSIVNQDYHSLLAPKAISYGAGLIDLFFREVEKEKQTLAFAKQNETLFGSILHKIVLGINGGFYYFKNLVNEKGNTATVAFSFSPLVETVQETENGANIEEITETIVNQTKATETEEKKEEKIEIRENIQTNKTDVAKQVNLSDTLVTQEKTNTPTETKETIIPYMVTSGETFSSPVIPPTDSDPPSIVLNIDECSQTIASGSCLFLSSVTINPHWSSSSSDLSFFTLNLNGTISTTTATSTQITISNNQTYQFSVSATDINNNTSSPVSQTIQTNSLPIVINEIAWSGTFSSPEDEWIELYNNTNEEINLNNWVLRGEDNTPYISLSGSIPAKGFYLLERGDDSVISDITANLIYSSDQMDDTNGEHLILSLNETVVDEIPQAFNWSNKGFSVQRNTTERYQPQLSGNDWSNWNGSIFNYVINGRDRDSNPIKGTPKRRNGSNHLISLSSELNNDTALTETNSPYLIGSGGLVVNSNVTLTLNSGTIIKFIPSDFSRLTINGRIVSNGEANKPNVFTSFYDKTYDNLYLEETIPQPGDWQKISLNQSDQPSLFTYTIFRYGGRYYDNYSVKERSMVMADHANNLSFQNCIFEHSQSTALYLNNTNNTSIISNIFQNNIYHNQPFASYAYGLVSLNSSPVVQNNTFQNNKYGALFQNSSATVENNVFNNQIDGALYVNGSGIYSNNSGSNNGVNAISLSGSLPNLIKKNSLPYLIVSNSEVPANSTSVIEAGSAFKFSSYPIYVSGTLNVNGESGNPVLFTNYSDDSDGIDIFNDGQTDISKQGNALYFQPFSHSSITHSVFNNFDRAIIYASSTVNLSDVSFGNSNWGVDADSDSVIEQVVNIILGEGVGMRGVESE